MTIYYASDNPNGFVTGKRFSIDLPCVTVMAAGMGGDSLGHWYFAEDGMGEIVIDPGSSAKGRVVGLVIDQDNPMPTVTAHGVAGGNPPQVMGELIRGIPDPSKPPYRVPLMTELPPWNGLRVVSTFSGAGGSCTGYRMAGFKVIWANEFVPAAQQTYKANADPDCVLDRRDIKRVLPDEILVRTGLAVGELDLFDGSPPCQAFSTAGKRERGWGQEKHYEHGAHQKNEELFTEYIRLLRGLMPRVFVAENVSGLVKGKAKGFFLEILRDLKASGYNVKCRVLDAQWLGVPQQRQRTIFIGVRDDLGLEPVFPKPLPYRYSVRDALPWITELNKHGGEYVDSSSQCAPSILSGDASRKESAQFSAGGWVAENTERRKFTIAELKRICAFPDDFILTGSYSQQWERLGNSVPPVMMYYIADALKRGVFDEIAMAR